MTLVPSLLPFVTPECHADEVGCRLLALRGKHHERHLRIRQDRRPGTSATSHRQIEYGGQCRCRSTSILGWEVY